MLPPARRRNQFDTFGRALAKYLLVLNRLRGRQWWPYGHFRGPQPAPGFTKFGGDFFAILETLAW